MSHIHIALVGNETSPVFAVIKFLQPDKIILVCSDGAMGSIKEAKTIANQLNSSENIQFKAMDPTNFNLINNAIDEILEDVRDDDYVTVNLTGGTKFWALAFYRKFSGRHDTQLYLFNQNNTLWNLLSNSCTELNGLDLDTIISLYGNNSTTFKDFRDYTDEDKHSLEKIERARRFHFKAFNSLVATLDKNNAEELKTKASGIFADSTGNCVMWSKPDKVVFNFRSHEKTYKILVSSPNAVSLAFNSGWFEYKVAKILSGWNKVKEIRLNCVFPLKPNFPKNEVDIIVNTDIKPIFVECKTFIHTATDIDKFATVVANYGGSACKALFITEQPLRDLPATKCKESNIAAFCLKDHTPEDLYLFLDTMLTEINK